MTDSQRSIQQPTAISTADADRLRSAIAAILAGHPDGLTPAEIIDCLCRRCPAGETGGDDFPMRVVREIVGGGFAVRAGKYFASTSP